MDTPVLWLLVGILLGMALGYYGQRVASALARTKPASGGQGREDQPPGGPRMGGGFVTRYRDFFAPLGELTIAFSLMEQRLDDAIRILKNLPYPEAANMAVNQDIKTKIDTFNAAANQAIANVPGDLKAEIPSLISALYDARERRHRAQHSPWLSIDRETGSAAKIGRRGKPFEWHDHTAASLQKDARFCSDVMMRVDDWRERFTNEVLVQRNTKTGRSS
jgi:hypothetical protein